jgi:hypothetical protein
MVISSWNHSSIYTGPSSIALTPTIALEASSKGLKFYLAVDTNLNGDFRINTYHYGDRVLTLDKSLTQSLIVEWLTEEWVSIRKLAVCHI